LRDGGATHDFVHHDIGGPEYVGSWKVAATLEHYLHEVFAAWVVNQMSAVSIERITAVRTYADFLA
jgi:hypothetical protein